MSSQVVKSSLRIRKIGKPKLHSLRKARRIFETETSLELDTSEKSVADFVTQDYPFPWGVAAINQQLVVQLKSMLQSFEELAVNGSVVISIADKVSCSVELRPLDHEGWWRAREKLTRIMEIARALRQIDFCIPVRAGLDLLCTVK